ncbi:MAG TPA: RHS repeat-associated core domain-containing protein [Thermoanaerobaculia bacterium]|jgi:RHS repeat-associated protein
MRQFCRLLLLVTLAAVAVPPVEGQVVSWPFPDRGVHTPVSGDITIPSRWRAMNSPYVVTRDVYVYSTLTIEPGTVIKFATGTSLTVRTGGTLTANGTTSQPIIFTSIKDDSAGYDTNIDEGASSPAPGDWARLAIEGHRDVDGVHQAFGSLTNVVIRYGQLVSVRFSAPVLRDLDVSSMSLDGLYLDTPPRVPYVLERLRFTNNKHHLYLYAVPSSTTIRDSIFRGATGLSAIDAAENTAASLIGNSIDDNGGPLGNLFAAIKVYGSPLVLRYNSITNNRNSQGVSRAIDSCCTTVDARNNWWGSTSGPEVQYQAETGGGSQITQYVQYDDWLGKSWIEEHKKGSFPWTLKAGAGTDVATGNFVLTERDLSISTIGFPLEITRTYNNKLAGNTLSDMGVGWTWSYGTKLETNVDTHGVVWERADGAKSYFKRLPDGTFAGEEGIFEKLVWDASIGSYRLTFKDQSVWLFDASGKLTRQLDQDGNVTVISRDGSGRIVTITEPTGRTLTFGYNGAYISRITDPLGRTYDYARGGNNAITSVTKRDGSGVLFATCIYGYTGPASAMTSLTDCDGNVLTQTFDSVNRVTTQRFNGNNQIRFVYGPGSDSWTGLWFPQYTTGVFDTRNRAHVYSYTSSNKVFEHLREQSIIGGQYYWYTEDRWSYTHYLAGTHTDIEGRQTLRVYDWANGNVKQLTEPGGRTTSYQYDGWNNRISASDNLARTTRYEYDAEQHLTKTIDPLGHETVTTYYANGLPQTVTDPRGNTTTYTYDTWGYLASSTNALGETTRFVHDAAGRRLSETNAAGESTSFFYDGRDNVRRVSNAFGDTQTFYDGFGRKTQVIDAEGRATTWLYDDTRNALWKTIDAKGGTVELLRDFYAGNVVEVRDPKGHATNFTYDDFNRRTSETDANGRTTRIEYFPSGRIARSIDAAQAATTYEYDYPGQLTRVNYPDGAVAQFAYDGVGNRTSMTDWTGTTNWTYDELDRVRRVTRTSWAVPLDYVYDDAGNLSSIVYEDAKPVRYRYDRANRLISVIDWQGRTTTYRYDLAGRIAGYTYPNGVAAAQTYDGIGRVRRLDYSRGNLTIGTFDYDYDRVGNRRWKRRTDGLFESYEYDELYRLTRATYPNGDTTSYTYDAAGNRLTSTSNGFVQSYAYDNADQLLGYSWDANGQLAGTPDKSYTWDARHKLARMIDQIGATDFVYDADGDRIRATRAGRTTNYAVNSVPKHAEVVMEQTNGVTTYHVYGHDLLYSIENGTPHYLHNDALGSVAAVSNDAGNRESTFEYDVFGLGRNGSGGFYWPSHRFTGEEQEPQNLTYLRARYYDPHTARFLSRDPFPIDAMDTQSVNRYAYVKNNPTNYVDPSGEWGLRSLLDGTRARLQNLRDRVVARVYTEPVRKIQTSLNIYKEVARGNVGAGASDAKRHAEAARRTTQEVGLGTALLLGTGNEVVALGLGRNGPAESLMDLYNNTVGMVAGARGRDAVDDRWLLVLPQGYVDFDRQTWQVFNLLMLGPVPTAVRYGTR